MSTFKEIALTVYIFGIVFALFMFPALAQTHEAYPGQSLRGEHPVVTPAHPDPYKGVKNASNGDCCGGADCADFYGDPRQGVKEGITGWFFGQWFVPDIKIIPYQEMPALMRDRHHLCVSSDHKNALCGFVAAGA